MIASAWTVPLAVPFLFAVVTTAFVVCAWLEGRGE